MDDEALMIIYHAVNGEVLAGTTTVMIMLDDIVSEEVARRCSKNGWPLPWADQEEQAPANDQPEPDGAA